MDRPRPAGVTGPTPAQVMGGKKNRQSVFLLAVCGGGLVELPMDIRSLILHGSRMSVLHRSCRKPPGWCRS